MKLLHWQADIQSCRQCSSSDRKRSSFDRCSRRCRISLRSFRRSCCRRSKKLHPEPSGIPSCRLGSSSGRKRNLSDRCLYRCRRSRNRNSLLRLRSKLCSRLLLCIPMCRRCSSSRRNYSSLCRYKNRCRIVHHSEDRANGHRSMKLLRSFPCNPSCRLCNSFRRKHSLFCRYLHRHHTLHRRQVRRFRTEEHSDRLCCMYDRQCSLNHYDRAADRDRGPRRSSSIHCSGIDDLCCIQERNNRNKGCRHVPNLPISSFRPGRAQKSMMEC